MFVNNFLGVNPFIEAFWLSDWMGKGIFFFLFALSILTWAIAIYKIIFLKKEIERSHKVYSNLKGYKGNLLQFDGDGEKSALLDLFHSLKKQTLELLSRNVRFSKDKSGSLSLADMSNLESHLMTGIAKERRKLEKSVFLLPMIVTLAPFLGLLGTVWGILGTFSDLQRVGGGGVQEMALGGLSLALTTTVLGLIDAIPALVGYSLFKSLIESFDTDMRIFATETLASIELQYRRVDVL